MKQKGPKVFAELVIRSNNIDPDYITKTLKLQPTKTWKKGQKRERDNGNYSFNYWEYKTRSKQTYDINTVLQPLIATIKSKRRKLKTLMDTPKTNGTLGVVTIMTDETPGLNFDTKTIKILAEIGLCIDIDQYINRE